MENNKIVCLDSWMTEELYWWLKKSPHVPISTELLFTLMLNNNVLLTADNIWTDSIFEGPWEKQFKKLIDIKNIEKTKTLDLEKLLNLVDLCFFEKK
ncbi:hypothetical protein [Geoalkalibacter halelectricus]|uniref:hypothetical protein n=1 Tax=Geoalkalibacter halelectricus TaxID=2847045 RepID=UPI003D250F19